jgi:hypothetical protein
MKLEVFEQMYKEIERAEEAIRFYEEFPMIARDIIDDYKSAMRTMEELNLQIEQLKSEVEELEEEKKELIQEIDEKDELINEMECVMSDHNLEV